MARDVRNLRAEASEAAAAGKHKKALAAYLELEQLEPRDANWSKRAAETYRRLGKDKDAIAAFTRAADRYSQSGFLVQAIAVCKLILQIDPKNDDALRRLAQMNEQVGAGPSRAIALAEANPNLADNAAVTALRTRGTTQLPPMRDKTTTAPPFITRTPTPPSIARTLTPPRTVSNAAAERGEVPRHHPPGSTPPPIAISRTKSKPIALPPDRAIETISLKDEVPSSFEREENSGVYVIPIDEPISGIEVALDDDPAEPTQHQFYGDDGEELGRASGPMIEIDPSDEVDDSQDLDVGDIDDVTELELGDVEEIPLAEPRHMPAAAAGALASTPLFAGLSQEALEKLVQQLTLVHLGHGEVLFREGDPGDALYVIVEGEVAVLAEGPPRVEMARLGPGSFIGEVALMTDQPRSATVQAIADAELLRIDRKTLSNVLSTHGEVLAAVLRFVRDRLVDRWTRTSPLFRPFDDQQRLDLAARFKFLEIDDGKKIITGGKRPDGLYIVLAGSFDVANAARVGPGELVGETALLSGTQLKSDVTASGKCLALFLPSADFRELIMTHPYVLEYIGDASPESRKLEIL
jgi:CRP-like cAMP-binding protein